MPYFKWKGIDLSGTDRTGVSFARTQDMLEKSLLQQEIALLSARQVSGIRARLFFKRGVGAADKAELCSQIAVLLNAGLRLDEALAHVVKTIKETYAAEVIADCARAVREGSRLSAVLECHAILFDSAAVALIAAGEESGKVARAFEIVSARYAAQDELMRKLKASLMMPAVTLLFFVITAFGVFIAIIPRFEALFVMINKPLPGTARLLFGISAVMRSRVFLPIVGVCIGIIFAAVRILARPSFKQRRDRLILAIPVIGALVWSYSMTVFLQTLALLVQGGVHLTEALAIAQKSIGNGALAHAVEHVRRAVETGSPLSISIARFPELTRGTHELESLCALGETTGDAAPLLLKAAGIYEHKTHRSLALITRLLPPLVLLCLGILIALLIFAVYAPLLNFSQLIS